MSLQEKIKYIVEHRGTKKNFIADYINMCPSDLSLFFRGRKKLNEEQETLLNKMFKMYNGLPF